MNYLILPSVLLLFACSTHQHLSHSDYNYSQEAFSYQTYQIVENPSLPVNSQGVITYGINKRLQALGYEPRNNNADLLIHYQLYEGKFRIKDFEQPNWSNWLNNVNKKRSSRSRYLKINGSAIYISIFDPKTRNIIWRGYSDSRNTYAHQNIAFEVYRILDDYTLLASKRPLSKAIAKGE